MGKIFEALKKAEKERAKIIKKGGDDPNALNTSADGEIDPHLVAYFDRMSPISASFSCQMAPSHCCSRFRKASSVA